MTFVTNHAHAKREHESPLSPLKIFLSEFELASGGEGQGEGDHRSLLNPRPLTLTLSPNCRILSILRIDFGGEGTCHRDGLFG